MKRVQAHAVIGIIVLSLLIGYEVGESLYPHDWVGVVRVILTSFSIGVFVALLIGSLIQHWILALQLPEDEYISATEEA